MLITIPKLLNAEDLSNLRSLIQQAQPVDGRATAGAAARKVKKNEEMQFNEQQHLLINRVLMSRLGASSTFNSAVMPLKIADPILARYTAGMAYGDHIDDPIMGSGQKFRTDVSMTIFISEPDEYEGGELTVHTPFGPQTVKLTAGDAVIYPSGSLHRVAEVTSGERLVAVAWIQSMVREPERRALLHELNQAREKLLTIAPTTSETKQVDHSYINLVRMWSDV